MSASQLFVCEEGIINLTYILSVEPSFASAQSYVVKYATSVGNHALVISATSYRNLCVRIREEQERAAMKTPKSREQVEHMVRNALMPHHVGHGGIPSQYEGEHDGEF